MGRDSEIWGHTSLLSGFHAHVHSLNAPALWRGPWDYFGPPGRRWRPSEPAERRHSICSNAPTFS